MSHEILRKIRISDGKVYITSADGRTYPVQFTEWECRPFSTILAENGKLALYAKLGEEIWNGMLQPQKKTKLCKLFVQARDKLRGMSFHTLEGRYAGRILGKMVESLEKDPNADLSGYVNEALALRDNRDYILEAAERTGFNYLNCASPDLQKDRDFALKVLRAGGRTAWFNYPTQFTEDKEFALEAVKLNGCLYRGLGESTRADREIIMAAFREEPGKTFHEHLPDLIPLEALLEPEGFEFDIPFIVGLIEVCPSMHLERMPALLEERDIVLKWAEVGKFFPYSAKKLPLEYLNDTEFQRILFKRFTGDKKDVLIKVFQEKGIQPGKEFE